MKFKIIVVLGVLVLSGCDIFERSDRINTYSYSSNCTATTMQGVFNYMYWTFMPESDIENYGETEYWALPHELEAKGSGDCEDLAIFAMYHLRRLGYDPSLVILDLPGTVNHAVIYLNGTYYDTTYIAMLSPLGGRRSTPEYPVIGRYSWFSTLLQCPAIK